MTTDHSSGLCESCGALSSELQAVRRVYLRAPGPDLPHPEPVLADVETWCIPCRTHYPHLETNSRRA